MFLRLYMVKIAHNLRALVMKCSMRRVALTTRVRTLESALEVLHGNLAAARQYLAALFHEGP